MRISLSKSHRTPLNDSDRNFPKFIIKRRYHLQAMPQQSKS
ncbi:hypothetical protein FDUTEX481_08448 [Tolypothrix sp. PCC 7601]|nr:hypothetical protein FDUTEX481_08448 [Tolypothrix sp. PCC 7601]